jgi:hypothetical protein
MDAFVAPFTDKESFPSPVIKSFFNPSAQDINDLDLFIMMDDRPRSLLPSIP